MFNSKRIAKLESEVSEINDVLTEESTEKCKEPHLGSEIDRKLDKSEFERIIGKKKSYANTIYGSYFFVDWGPSAKEKTLFERIEELEEKLENLAKAQNLEYKEETTEFKGYKPVKSKRGRPKRSTKKK